jgi:hypothetical protein
MADGASIDHIVKIGSIQTSDDTEQTLVSASIPVGTDGIVAIEAWAHGVRIDTSPTRYLAHVIAGGTIDAGTFVINSSGPWGDPLDDGPSGYVVDVDASTNTARLRVIGAVDHTVRWHGELRIRITEAAIETDFG